MLCLNSMPQMFTRKGGTEVHEFDSIFLGSQAHYKVTSVIGHVFRLSFFLIMLTRKEKGIFLSMFQIYPANIFLVPGSHLATLVIFKESFTFRVCLEFLKN